MISSFEIECILKYENDVDKLQDSKKVKEVYDYAKNKLIIIKYQTFQFTG